MSDTLDLAHLTDAQFDALYKTRVQPLLASKCYACHTQQALGGLRLDSRESVAKGGNSGPAIIPGRPADSLLAAR